MLTTENLRVMFEEHAKSDEITQEQVIAVIGKNLPGAAQAIRQALHQLAQSRHPSTNEQCRVLEIAWNLFGVRGCLNSILPHADQTAFAMFVVDKLRSNAGDFSDSDLNSLEVPTSSEAVWAAVKQARVRRIKDEAQRVLANPAELTSDLKEVKRYAEAYGFPVVLGDLLEKVQVEFLKGDGFDQAGMLKHLRTFFEQLHVEVAKKLHDAKPETIDQTPMTQCQNVIDHLCNKGVLPENAKAFARGLYGLLSSEGVHKLQSTREYVRLCRNMVAEYGLILFYELDRRLAE